MNKDKLEVGDLVTYSEDPKWRKGVGLVVASHFAENELNAWEIYWFKYESIWISNGHYLTKLSPT
jgi:hypothetical protein